METTETAPRCRHCGFDHPSRRCNRPEGVAAHGGRVLRISDQPIEWAKAAQEHQKARGRACGYRSSERGKDGRFRARA